MNILFSAIRGVCLAIFLPLMSSASAISSELESLTFFTENYPPANFESNGQLTGYSVDILRAAGEAVGQDIKLQQISIFPWPRSYRNTLNMDNTVLFSTTRTEHREDLFQWVGPITDIRVVVMARKQDNITITNPIDMGRYKIGVIRDDIGEQSLLQLGIPMDSMQEAMSVTTLAEQLMKERIELLAYAEKAAYWWSKQAGINSDLFEVVYVLEEGYLYYAFNNNVDKKALKQLQKGLDIIKSQKNENGMTIHQEILSRYR
ncbi:transporter substrate-binding domain-containing protein [Vibrio makurazakiensis]|uniref:substrate-binding periplasmic protein n=1 Tax=Vibrio makurazakiensis TaxID=2910250 RepID=UPI003D0AD6AC